MLSYSSIHNGQTGDIKNCLTHMSSHMQKLNAENMHIRSAIEFSCGSLAAVIRYLWGPDQTISQPRVISSCLTDAEVLFVDVLPFQSLFIALV